MKTLLMPSLLLLACGSGQSTTSSGSSAGSAASAGAGSGSSAGYYPKAPMLLLTCHQSATADGGFAVSALHCDETPAFDWDCAYDSKAADGGVAHLMALAGHPGLYVERLHAAGDTHEANVAAIDFEHKTAVVTLAGGAFAECN